MNKEELRHLSFTVKYMLSPQKGRARHHEYLVQCTPVFLPDRAVDWSVVCDFGIFWSYSFTFYKCFITKAKYFTINYIQFEDRNICSTYVI